MAIADRPARHGAPIDVSADHSFTVNIRIHVYPQGDRWYAASTEYTLMAEGATQQEAVQRFIESTMAFLTSALAHGWIDAINRRPSILRRLEIRRRVLIARLLRRKPFTALEHLRLDGAQLTLS